MNSQGMKKFRRNWMISCVFTQQPAILPIRQGDRKDKRSSGKTGKAYRRDQRKQRRIVGNREAYDRALAMLGDGAK